MIKYFVQNSSCLKTGDNSEENIGEALYILIKESLPSTQNLEFLLSEIWVPAA